MLIRLAERLSSSQVHAGTMTGAGGRPRRLGPWAHTGFFRLPFARRGRRQPLPGTRVWIGDYGEETARPRRPVLPRSRFGSAAPPHGRSASRGWWARRDGTKAEHGVACDAVLLHAIGIAGVSVRVRRPFGTTQGRGQMGDQAAAVGARVTVLRQRKPTPCVQQAGVAFADSPSEVFFKCSKRVVSRDHRLPAPMNGCVSGHG